MKKVILAFLSALMILSLAACGNNSAYTPEEVDKKVASGELGSIIAHYSVKNETEEEGFYVQFNSALESFDYYDAEGTLVVFDGDEVVYDKNGKPVDIEAIKYGQALLIAFDGKAYDTDPATIKAYKVTLAE